MKRHVLFWTGLMTEAVLAGDMERLVSLADTLEATENAKSFLRAKFYGDIGDGIDKMAAKVLPNTLRSE